ncbi:AAA family ATPase [Yinghuangia aomiensis]
MRRGSRRRSSPKPSGSSAAPRRPPCGTSPAAAASSTCWSAPRAPASPTPWAALTAAWESAGFEVFGLAVSERAAQVLHEEGVDHVANVAKVLFAHEFPDMVDDPDAYAFRPGQLVIVDEAGTASTGQLRDLRRLAAEAGAKLLLTGDHGQTASVDAGGMFGYLAEKLPARARPRRGPAVPRRRGQRAHVGGGRVAAAARRGRRRAGGLRPARPDPRRIRARNGRPGLPRLARGPPRRPRRRC